MHTDFIKRFYAYNTGEGDNTGGAGNVDATIPNQDFLNSVPEDYKSAPYLMELAKSEDPTSALWSKFHAMHESLQSRPGGVPGADADANAWERWASSVAPQDVTAYGDIKPQLPEEKAALKEVVESLYTPDFVNPLLETARKVGIQPYQLKALSDVFNNNNLTAAESFYQSQQQAQLEAQQKAEAEKQAQDIAFDNYCLAKFGNQRSEIVGKGFEFLTKYVDPELAESIKSLPNEALAAVAAFAYKIDKTYNSENRLPSTTTNTVQDVLETGSQLKQKMSELMNNEAYANTFHANHESVKAQVLLVGQQMAKLGIGRTGT